MNQLVRIAEWLSQPPAFYAVLGVGLALCLSLFLSLKAEIRRLAKHRLEDQEQIENLRGALESAHTSLRTLENNLQEVQQQTGMLTAPAPTRSGMNLSKRTQVLRLHRAGEDPAKIACALGLPRGEVDLLIKVQGVVLRQIQ